MTLCFITYVVTAPLYIPACTNQWSNCHNFCAHRSQELTSYFHIKLDFEVKLFCQITICGTVMVFWLTANHLWPPEQGWWPPEIRLCRIVVPLCHGQFTIMEHWWSQTILCCTLNCNKGLYIIRRIFSSMAAEWVTWSRYQSMTGLESTRVRFKGWIIIEPEDSRALTGAWPSHEYEYVISHGTQIHLW